MSNKSSYFSIDPNNRLVVNNVFSEKTSRKKSFKEKAVSYEYVIASPGARDSIKKLVLEGSWNLTPEYNLEYRISGSKTYFGRKKIILQGSFEKVSGDGLVFRVQKSSALKGLKSTTVSIKGKWLSDTNNRIAFSVSKHKGGNDILTFQGAWDINKHNEVIYKITETNLKTKKKVDRKLVFRGHWDIGKNRIIYSFEGSNSSLFVFKAALQSKSLRASEGKIKYQVAIKYTRKKSSKTIKREVVIYGKWKFSKDFAVGFEVKYSDRKIYTIDLSIETFMTEKDSIKILLKSKKGQKLGIEVTFNKIFNNDAELFLSIGRFATESRILGGIKVKF